MTKQIKKRLEYLRSQLDGECISLDELLELQSLAEHIESGDVQLLEAAGVPESQQDNPAVRTCVASGEHDNNQCAHCGYDGE